MTLNSPYAAAMGFTVERDNDGGLIIVMGPAADKRGRPGFVHGGALAGLLETVAVVTVIEAIGATGAAQVKPINFTVNFLRGAREKPTYARAKIERLGRRIANVEAIAWQDDPDAPVAMAQANLMLVREG